MQSERGRFCGGKDSECFEIQIEFGKDLVHADLLGMDTNTEYGYDSIEYYTNTLIPKNIRNWIWNVTPIGK